MNIRSEPLNKHQIKTVFKACCNKDWWQSHSPPNTLPATIAELQKVSQGDAPYRRTLLFAALLARYFPQISDSLEKWVKSQGCDWQLLSEAVAPIYQEIQDELNPPVSFAKPMSYLVIKVDDTNPKSEEYFVNAWFAADSWEKRKAITVPTPKLGQKGFTIEEIPSLLDGFLDQVDVFQELTIEFFLPYDLLTLPVDTWETQGLGISEAIGHNYRVSIRSVDRLRPTYNRYRGIWQQKWQKLNQESSPLRNNFIVGDKIDPKELLAQLKQETVYGLQLERISASETFRSLYAAFLQTGTPLGLWIRQSSSQCTEQENLTELLDYCVMELPEQVRQTRKKANIKDPEAHIGHHLTLVWEDPARLPEVLSYQMP